MTTDTYRCGDYAALTGYLYDDCEPDERTAIDAHLQTCRACADELQALSGTRRQLASWAPPETSLGFRITPADESRVVRFPAGESDRTPRSWWRQPLPAWAQIAAALIIFAAGLSIGTARGRASTSPVVGVSPDVLAAISRLDRRVSGVERLAQEGTAPVVVAHRLPSERAILQRVGHQIAAAEERQRQERQEELAIRVLDLANTQQRKVEQIEASVAKVQNDFWWQQVANQR